MSKYVVFRLANEQYGLPIEEIRSIETILPITRVPGVDPFLLGVINLRGVVIPVMDLRLRFGLQANSPTSESRIVVISPEDSDSVGIIVDAADSVVEATEKDIQPPADSVDALGFVEAIATVDGRIFAILNIKNAVAVA